MPYLSHLCIPNWLQSRTKILSNFTESLRGLRETKYYFQGRKKGFYTHVLYTTPKFAKWRSRRDLAPFTGKKCLPMLWKKWHAIYFGQCHWLWGKNAREMLLRWKKRWQLFLAVTALQFLATVRDQKLFWSKFDVSVFSREYSVLKLAKNCIGMVWFSVIDVEIAGLHLEDMPKRWVIFSLFVYCMFRATWYKKKL